MTLTETFTKKGYNYNRYPWRGNCVSQHLSGADSNPAGRDLNLQKLNYQYLTTSVAVVLVDRLCVGCHRPWTKMLKKSLHRD